MVALIAARLVWCGSPFTTVIGVALLPLYAMSLAGQRPYLTDALSFVASLGHFGGRGLVAYVRGILKFGRRFAFSSAIAVALPAAIGVAFSVLFVLANPDLVRSISETLSRIFDGMHVWLIQISPGECLFLVGVAWVAMALLRPSFERYAARLGSDG